MYLKSKIYIFAIFLVSLATFYACSSDDDAPVEETPPPPPPEEDSDENDILTFSFTDQTGAADIDNVVHNVEIEVANGTDLTSLTPTFTISASATASPASGTEGDYSSVVTITVTAEDGSTQDWEIDVTEAEAGGSNDKDILTFNFPDDETADGDIDGLAHNVEIEVANGTDLTSLTPVFTVSEGATASPASGTEGDYSSVVIITVTAEDGSTQDWEIDVTEAEAGGSKENDILTFIFIQQLEPADIDNVLHKIEIRVAEGTNRSSLTPVFTVSEGATALPPSGTTSDYSDIFTIRVTAEDGSFQDWEVDVSEGSAGSNDKNILTFIIPQQTGPADIDNILHNIEVEVEDGTDRSSLTPVFTISEGATAFPPSGTTADYRDRFTIRVTAEDGSFQDWEVDVSEEL